MKNQNTPNPPVHPTRRDFLKGILAAGAFTIITPGLLAAQDKNQKAGKPKAALPKTKTPPARFTGDKVRLACVGIGNRGHANIRNFYESGMAEIVALCDTDIGAEPTGRILQMFPTAPRFQDFRKMLDKMAGQIDAVCINTPDFSHFPITMLAMSLGKHVYVEKPLAHSFRQHDLLMAAEKKYKVATQMGNQGHSDANYFQFKAWTEAGIIKNVTRITAYMNAGRRWHDATTLKKYKIAFSRLTGYLPGQPIPATLDWDTWLATARDHKYNEGYTEGEWRSWFDFGNGALGDWGAHIFDTAHRFLDLGLPDEVNVTHMEGHNPFVFPQASTLAFRFPKRGSQPPLDLTWYDGRDNRPPLPENMGAPVGGTDIPPPSSGADDMGRLPPGKIIYGEGLTFKGGSHGATLKIIPEEKAADMAARLPEVPKSPSNHYENFLLACKGVEQARSPFSISAPLCQVMNLGVIAQRLNTSLKFDRATRQITNNKTANDLLGDVQPRKGWEQYYKL